MFEKTLILSQSGGSSEGGMSEIKENGCRRPVGGIRSRQALGFESLLWANDILRRHTTMIWDYE